MKTDIFYRVIRDNQGQTVDLADMTQEELMRAAVEMESGELIRWFLALVKIIKEVP